MQKLEALMEAVEGAYFVQSDQVASGRAGWAEQRGDCLARPRGGWHAAAGCGRAVSQRLNTEFLISAAEFIGRIYWHFSGQGSYFLTISTDESNNILKFSAGRIFIYFLPKANVDTIIWAGMFKG
jgi:hypothetical protein